MASTQIAPSKPNKFISFLQTVGKDFKKGLDYTLRLEPAVEAGLDIADPPIAALLHVTTATILSVEQKFAAMGQQSGSGTQKAAQTIQILEPMVKSILAPYGVTVNTEYMQKYIDSFVAILNMLPAISATAPAPAVNAFSPDATAKPIAVTGTLLTNSADADSAGRRVNLSYAGVAQSRALGI